MFIAVDGWLWIHRPGHDDSALWVEIEEIIDAIALRFQFQQYIGLFGKVRNHFADDAGVRLQRKAIGDLSRADAKKMPAMVAQCAIRFIDQIADVAEHL